MNDLERELTERLSFAVEMAREAGRATLHYFHQAVEVERKADQSPVTVADREAEELMRWLLKQSYPEDGILGEEAGETAGESGFRWILDPIDGTKTFIAGVPLYGTLVGLEFRGQSVLGVIELPALDTRVYGLRGGGAFWQAGKQPTRKAQVTEINQLADGLFVTTETGSYGQREAMAVYQQLEEQAWYTRTWGDCYGYYLVATGQAALMIDPVMNLWDAAAILPIIEEAGGVFTDWQGNATIAGGEGIATNRQLLDQVLAITRPYARRDS